MTAAEDAVPIRYPYVISLIVVTLRYESGLKYIRTADARYVRAIPYLLVSLLLGWWGMPWGPLLTLRAVWDCLNGGVEQPA